MPRPSAETGLSLVPWPDNADSFVGRDAELKSLHALLLGGDAVGIRPAALTGQGGIGKTQLAVRYCHAHKQDYPDGVFWISAVDMPMLSQGLTTLGRALRADPSARTDDEARTLALDYLRTHTNALLVLDNVEDPKLLDIPIDIHCTTVAGLACRRLFTTRNRNPGKYRQVEVKVLPEEAALELLLSHEPRKAVFLDKNHPERPEAQEITRRLGRLPLALELAAAFLGAYPKYTLAAYHARLRDEGCLVVTDREAEELGYESLHKLAVEATLRTHWDALRKSDDEARHVLRVAGQFAEAEVIEIRTLGIFSGVPSVDGGATPSALRRALRRLHAARLVEELEDAQIRLHPLIREFAQRETSTDETEPFRNACAERVWIAYTDIATLETDLRNDGIDSLEHRLRTAVEFAVGESRENLSELTRLIEREAHILRAGNPADAPAWFPQHIHVKSYYFERLPFSRAAVDRLESLKQPYFRLDSRTVQESPELRRILSGHEREVLCVALSHDGRFIVSGSYDTTVAIWDRLSGQLLNSLQGHQDSVNAVAISTDERFIVSGSEDTTVAIWDRLSGQLLNSLQGHQDSVNAVAISSDGRFIVSGSADRTVAIWDRHSGQLLNSLQGHQDSVNAVAISSDGRFIVSGSGDKTVAIWDRHSGQLLNSLQRHQGTVHAVAISNDGRFIVSGSYDTTVAIWDRLSGQLLNSLQGHQSAVYAVAISNDGRFFVSGSADKTVAIWDRLSGQLLNSLQGHQLGVNAVAISSDGRFIVSSSWDKTVAIWDRLSGQLLNSLQRHQNSVNAVAFSHDGRFIVSCSDDETVAVWDRESGQFLKSLRGHQRSVRAVALSRDGRFIVSGSYDKTVAVWDRKSGQLLNSLRGHQSSVISVALSHDGRFIVSGSDDKTVAVWDRESGRQLKSLQGHQGPIKAVALSHDGRFIVSSSNDKTVAVWDRESGKLLKSLRGHENWVNAVALSRDGRFIVSGSYDKTVAVWDRESGKLLKSLRGHENSVYAVALSHEGRFIVSGSSDKTVAVWEIGTGVRVAELTIDAAVTAVACGPDGSICVGDLRGDLYCFRLVGPRAGENGNRPND